LLRTSALTTGERQHNFGPIKMFLKPSLGHKARPEEFPKQSVVWNQLMRRMTTAHSFKKSPPTPAGVAKRKMAEEFDHK